MLTIESDAPRITGAEISTVQKSLTISRSVDGPM